MLKMLWAVVRAAFFLMRNPNKTEELLKFADTMHALGHYDAVIERLKSDPDVRALFESRHVRGLVDMNKLSLMPEGTLGYEFVQYARRNDINPNYFFKPGRVIENDHDYYEVRVRETHDVWHVVLGFDTDEPGELGVQGFMVAQFSPPTSTFLLAGAFVRALFRYPDRVFAYTQAVSKGFEIGVRCKQFFGIKWEDYWNIPLSQLRLALNVPHHSLAKKVQAEGLIQEDGLAH